MNDKAIRIVDIGLTGYWDAINKQKVIQREIIDGRSVSTVLFLEHEPVVTIGRDMLVDNAFNAEYFKGRGIPIIRSNRGGGITFHAPGQLVIYPTIDLGRFCRKDVAFFIDTLEIVAKEALLSLGLKAKRKVAERGVWAKDRKIAFIGVGFRRWVTLHGMSININNSNEAFANMNVCGQKDITVTSLCDEIGEKVSMEYAKRVFCRIFKEVFIRRYPLMKGEGIEAALV